MRSGLRAVFAAVLVMVFCSHAASAADPFQRQKSAHFVIEFTLESQRGEADAVLNRAEAYYDVLCDQIGCRGLDESWTWEDRVKIVLYPDEISYSRFTGQPVWSKAYASRNSRFFAHRMIVSYMGQAGFAEEALPHELAHLVFWDMTGFRKDIPLWYEEGVAQLAEQEKCRRVQDSMAQVVEAGQAIPFRDFHRMEIAAETDPLKVSLFYAQSLSVVLFMRQSYGRDSFYRLNRNLAEGRDFEDSLRRSYPGIFTSLEDLEHKWRLMLMANKEHDHAQ